MAQLIPLSLTVCCFSKIQIGFTFLVPAHLGSPGQRAVKRVCVLSNRKSIWPVKPVLLITKGFPPEQVDEGYLQERERVNPDVHEK